MRLKIKGMIHSPLELALPLQVINYPARVEVEQERTTSQGGITTALAHTSDQWSLLGNDVESDTHIGDISPPPYDYY
jgi:hypothetical protein